MNALEKYYVKYRYKQKNYLMAESGSENSSDNCPICRCPMISGESCVTTICNHEYHFNCFMRMANTSDTCAICRSSLYPIEENSTIETQPQEDGDSARTRGIGTSSTEVIEIEVRPADLVGLRQHVQSRLAEARRGRARGTEDDDDINILGFEEDSDLRFSRLTFSIFQSCEQGELARVRSIIGEEDEMKYAVDDDNNTLVHEAVFSDSEPLLRYLINDLNLPVNCTNRDGMTPLHFAAYAKSARTANLLINCGAFVDPRDDSGKTPLMVACQKNDNPMCLMLLDKGASVRNIDKLGESALHHASRGRCLACIRTLIRQPREDLDCQNFIGDTPLHTACQAGSHTAVRFMLTGGADPDIKNRSGDMPINLVSRENSRLRSLIQRHSSM